MNAISSCTLTVFRAGRRRYFSVVKCFEQCTMRKSKILIQKNLNHWVFINLELKKFPLLCPYCFLFLNFLAVLWGWFKFIQVLASSCRSFQVFASSCQFMQVHASSCKFMQVHASFCKFMQVYASSCKFMQLFSSSCRFLQDCQSSCRYTQVHES